jgi:hypothetical protein
MLHGIEFFLFFLKKNLVQNFDNTHKQNLTMPKQRHIH